ncbi:MAG: hypothetical protein Q8R13_03835 [bacterium]|nr:hypothetical protein [bacterium]MDZ4296650.1 hypothetical protein [Patescibacteria group bacterium]
MKEKSLFPQRFPDSLAVIVAQCKTTRYCAQHPLHDSNAVT